MPAYLFFPSLSFSVCVCVYDARDASAQFDPFHYFLGIFFALFVVSLIPAGLSKNSYRCCGCPRSPLPLLSELLLKVKWQKAIFKNCYYKSAAKQKLG